MCCIERTYFRGGLSDNKGFPQSSWLCGKRRNGCKPYEQGESFLQVHSDEVPSKYYKIKKVHFLKISSPCTVYIYTLQKTKERPRTEKSFEPNGEIRTNELPKKSESKKVHFIKIVILFTSLIPCLIPPTDDRENTERRAHQLPVTQK